MNVVVGICGGSCNCNLVTCQCCGGHPVIKNIYIQLLESPIPPPPLSRKSGPAALYPPGATERVNIGQKPDFTFSLGLIKIDDDHDDFSSNESTVAWVRRARRTKSSRPEGPKAGPKGRQLDL